MYNRLENECVETEEFGPVHYSRFIASYIKAHGDVEYREEFSNWLESLGCLTSEDIDRIIDLATCGKMELEKSAKKYLFNLYFGEEMKLISED